MLGLSLSLTFVILIGVYNYQERSVDRQLEKGERLEVLCMSDPGGANAEEGFHHIAQRYLKQVFPQIESSCGVTSFRILVDKDGEKIQAKALSADSTFFSLFNYKLIEGDRTTCLNDEDGLVLTQSFARKMFGDADPMGKPIEWQGRKRRVSGVMQDMDNTIFVDADVLMKFTFYNNYNYSNTDESVDKGEGVNLMGSSIFLLMHQGTTLTDKTKQITDCIHSHWNFFNDKTWPQQAFTARVAGLYLSGIENSNDTTRRGNNTLLSILSLAALVILFFAITNYINLTVAQSGYRAREMATRRLFGASRMNVFGKMVMESTMMVYLSLIIADLLAIAFAPAFGEMVDRQLSLSTFVKSCGIALPLLLEGAGGGFVGIIAGIVPAALTSRVKPIEIIKGSFRRQTKMVMSRVFITVQNIITIVMLSCAAIMVSQTLHLVHAPLGFNTDNVILVQTGQQNKKSQITHFMDDLRRQPSVENVTASWGTPVDGGNNNTLPLNNHQFSFQIFVADKNFFDVFGLKLKNGAKVLTHHFYFNRQAVNDVTRLMKYTLSEFPQRVQLAGVDTTANYGGEFMDFHINNIQRERHPMVIYVADSVPNPWYVSVKVNGNAAEAYRQVSKVFHDNFHQEMTDEDAQFADITIQHHFDEETRTSRLVAMFAFIAIVISLLGLIAMSTYFIQQRRKEIAIRKVFGSTSGEVGRRLIRSFLGYVLLAFVIAVPIVFYLMSGWISQYSYRLGLWWLWIPLSGVVVLCVSYAAVAVQSHRAARMNPAVNLKSE